MRFLSNYLLTLILLAISFTLTTPGRATIFDNISPHSNRSSPTQPILAREPEIVSNAIGNLPAIRFDKTNTEFLNYNGSSLANSNYAIFIVEKRINSDPNNYFLGTTATPDTGNNGLILGYASENQIVFGQGANKELIAIEPFVIGRVVLHTFIQDNSFGKKYYRDGALVFTSSTNKTPLSNNDNATIGRNGNDYYDGFIAEIAAYKRALSEAEIKSIHTYLLNKWVTINEIPENTSCNTNSPGYVTIPNGTWSNSGIAANKGSISIICDFGTTQSGTVGPLVCRNGIYSGTTTGSCSSGCGDPNTSNPLTGGSWDLTQASHSDIISGTCTGGFTGSPTIQCSNGSYINAGTCVNLNCPFAPPALSNGSWGVSSATNSQTISGTCNGPTYTGSPTIQCVNGSYTNFSGSCLSALDCNFDPDTTNALTAGNWDDTSATNGNTINGTCNSGFTPSPTTPTIQCVSGSYTNLTNSCEANCTTDPDISNPLANGNWVSTSAIHNQTINGICNSLYLGNPTNPPTIKCVSGSYTNASTCVITTCPAYSMNFQGQAMSRPITAAALGVGGNCVAHSGTYFGNLIYARCCSNGKWAHLATSTTLVSGNPSDFNFYNFGDWNAQSCSNYPNCP